jgi:hypothetical protein
MTIKFSIVNTARTFGLELRERNYPIFEGRYNAYISVYGQLSGDYIGNIETPLRMDVSIDELPQLLLEAEQFVTEGKNHRVSVW